MGREDGAPPPVDLAAERRNGDFVRAEILAGTVAACHDVADGGLLVAIAEMALAGDTGATAHWPHLRITPAVRAGGQRPRDPARHATHRT
jgi:phosphoribosylformylglycinamidine (FGAM) synthase-like enzyme